MIGREKGKVEIDVVMDWRVKSFSWPQKSDHTWQLVVPPSGSRLTRILYESSLNQTNYFAKIFSLLLLFQELIYRKEEREELGLQWIQVVVKLPHCSTLSNLLTKFALVNSIEVNEQKAYTSDRRRFNTILIRISRSTIPWQSLGWSSIFGQFDS